MFQPGVSNLRRGTGGRTRVKDDDNKLELIQCEVTEVKKLLMLLRQGSKPGLDEQRELEEESP